MMLNVAVPAGWQTLERTIGDGPIRQVVEQFAQEMVDLPGDPGEGPDMLSFALDENTVNLLGGREAAAAAVRRVLAAFVANRQGTQPSSPFFPIGMAAARQEYGSGTQ